MAWPRERQIEFPPQRTHLRALPAMLLALSVACIIVTVIILLVHPSGEFIGPW
jgi:hypothetical protein